VNNAGIGTRGTLHRPDREAIRRVLDVNLGGTMWAAPPPPRFVEQRTGGAIVNVSSIHGRRSFANHAAYDSSKGCRRADPEPRRRVRPGRRAGQRRRPRRHPDTAPRSRDPREPRPGRGAADARVVPPLRRVGEPGEIAAVVASCSPTRRRTSAGSRSRSTAAGPRPARRRLSTPSSPSSTGLSRAQAWEELLDGTDRASCSPTTGSG
jgi:NAD(P)-dependent dehydrogenase (short-subunit alcohol dehydrogenase family)